MPFGEVDTDGFTALFDGRTLAGWHAAPRVYGSEWPGGPDVNSKLQALGAGVPPHPELHPAKWTVQGGTVIGEQAAPGYGGYLVSDDEFGDFELLVDVFPDWPADTGVMVRRRRDSWEGFQVLLDHRPSGGIGGFFGNGLASFHVLPFAIDAQLDDFGRVIRLIPADPSSSPEPVTAAKQAQLTHAATVEEFIRAWKVGEWNQLRIRCVGELPVITTWMNGLKIAEVDTARLQWPNYNPSDVLDVLGVRGHIALEVHDNDDMFGDARWGPGAQCRWRNARIRQFD